MLYIAKEPFDWVVVKSTTMPLEESRSSTRASLTAMPSDPYTVPAITVLARSESRLRGIVGYWAVAAMTRETVKPITEESSRTPIRPPGSCCSWGSAPAGKTCGSQQRSVATLTLISSDVSWRCKLSHVNLG